MDTDCVSLLENAPDVIFCTDDGGHVKYVSAAVRELLGYEPHEVVGTPVTVYLHPDELGRLEELAQRLEDGEKVRGAILRARHRQGRDVQLLFDASPRFDAAGRFIGQHGIARDVTDERRELLEHTSLLERAAGLHQMGKALSSAAELSKVHQAIADYPASLGAEASWLARIDEDTGMRRLAAWHGRDAEALAATCAQGPCPGQRAIALRRVVVESMAEPSCLAMAMVRQARSRGYATFAALPMVWGDRLLGVLCVCSRQAGFFDGWKVVVLELFTHMAATALAGAQALERARQSEQRFQELVEQLPCVVYAARACWPPVVEFISSNCEQYTGYAPGDFYADPLLVFKCVHPDDRQRVIERVRANIGRPEPYAMEFRALHRNGRDLYHAAARFSPVLDATGRVVSRRGVVVDVTEQKGLEQELLQSQRLAAIGEMATMMAHEIRNPLAGISLCLPLLRDGLDGQGPLGEYLDDIDEGLRRINATVSRMLDFARARQPELRHCALAEIIEAARRLTATYARKSDVTVAVELPPGLPGLVADPTQLEQLFVNLILNACKAMPDGGHLAIRAAVRGERLNVEVSDTGIGIEPEQIGRIFNPFYSGFGDGTGLGLSLCQRIVAAHGGTISVQSTPGQGSTFHIELPLEPPHGSHSAH